MTKEKVLFDHSKEVEDILAYLEKHPEGASNFEISKAIGCPIQTVLHIMRSLYMCTDKVYVTGYVLSSFNRRPMTLTYRWCLYKYRDCEEYNSYIYDENVLYKVLFSFGDRRKRFAIECEMAQEDCAKLLIKYKQDVFKFINNNKNVTKKDIENEFGKYGISALNVLHAHGDVFYDKGVCYTNSRCRCSWFVDGKCTKPVCEKVNV